MSSEQHVKARLLDYYLGDPATDDLEEHLFECGECAAALERIHRTATAIVLAVREAALGSGATTALLNRMSRDRLNVRHYTILPGETVACSVAPNDDFMAGRLVLPDGDFERIDMRVLDASAQELMRVDDVVVDARHRQVILFIPAQPVLSEGSATTHYVLVAPSASGEREIGRYSMAHSAIGEE